MPRGEKFSGRIIYGCRQSIWIMCSLDSSQICGWKTYSQSWKNYCSLILLAFQCFRQCAATYVGIVTAHGTINKTKVRSMMVAFPKQYRKYLYRACIVCFPGTRHFWNFQETLLVYNFFFVISTEKIAPIDGHCLEARKAWWCFDKLFHEVCVYLLSTTNQKYLWSCERIGFRRFAWILNADCPLQRNKIVIKLPIFIKNTNLMIFWNFVSKNTHREK